MKLRRPVMRSGRSVLLSALALALAIPPLTFTRSVTAVAAEPSPARPEIATYAGQPIGGTPTEVAQQPYAIATIGRSTYVADPTNHVVRLLLDTKEFAFAGNGGFSVEGDAGDPKQAQVAGAYAVAAGKVTRVGLQVTGFDIYLADTFGHKVRRVTVSIPPVDSQNGAPSATITTIAGTGTFGFAGDGGAATAAQLNSPYGVAWDAISGTVYVADTLNNRIRAIASDGTISTVLGAGAPSAALQVALNQPRGLAMDSLGRLYVADTGNHVIRRYDPRPFSSTTGYNRATATVQTLAGDGNPGYLDGVTGPSARLRQPAAVAVDGQGNLYIADTGNNVVRELVLDASKQDLTANSSIRTVAGNGTSGYAGDEGPATQAELNAPFGVAVRDDGDVLIADTGNNYLRLLDAVAAADGSHHIHKLAGNGTASFAGDGQAPANAQLAGPGAIVTKAAPIPGVTGVAPQTAGVRYVADTFNQAIRWFATSGTVQTLVGTGGVAGPADAGPGHSTHLNNPMGAALDPAGAILYVADTFNNQVRRVDLKTDTVSPFAGTGQAGFSGDGHAAVDAQLSYPTGVAVDAGGNVFIADAYNARVRRVDTSGTITTVAGTGQLGYTGDGGDARKADLYFPYGVTVDSAQPPTLFITDSFNNRVRQVDGHGVITTVAGDGTPDFSDAVPATTAHLDRPWSTAIDGGSLYIADFLNHRVRKVDRTSQVISTVAGVGTSGLLGDLGKADQAEVDGPHGVQPIGNTGALLVADSFNDRLRWIGVTQTGVYRSAVQFAAQNLATSSPNQSVTVTSMGTGLLVLGPVNVAPGAQDFVLDPTGDACSRQRLEPGVSCSFAVSFMPRAPGNRAGSLLIPDDAANAPQQVTLSGRATAPQPAFSVSSLGLRQTLAGVSDPQSVTLSNSGDGALNVTAITIEGSDSAPSPDFVQSNDCPSSLAPGSKCTITVRLNQIPSGSRAGMLTIADNATGSPQRIPVTGAVIAPTVTLTPSGLGFASNVGQTARAQAVQLVNTGEGALTLSAIKVIGSSDFSAANNCPTVVTPHASCTLTVSFTPSGTGQQQATIRLADDARDSPQQLQLLGFGTMPAVRVSPRQLGFSQNLSDPLQTQPITFTNTGDGPLTISNLAVTGDYRQTNNCPGVVFAGESCTIRITFAPATTGQRNGSLILTDDADSVAGSQQVVAFSGTAFAPAVALSPTLLAPSVNVHGTAPPQTVILRNSGDGTLRVTGVGLAGSAAGEYTIVGNDCSNPILPGQTCSITISFSPSGAGLRPATLTITDDARGSPHLVLLRGVGTGPVVSLSAATLGFGTVPANTTSAPLSVVLTNTGNGPLAISSISSPAGGEFSETNNCPSNLGPGGSCTITVTFTPVTAGPRPSQTVVISTNALNGGGVFTITLTGSGS